MPKQSTSLKLRKLNFMNRDRRVEPMTKNDKYILETIERMKHENIYELQEGVYDPNILKAFFLAGGIGSGKSYVVKRTTGGLGMKIVNSDIAFEKKLKDAGLSTDLRELDPEVRDEVRGRAKE